MKKQITALILAIVLALSLTGTALAAEDVPALSFVTTSDLHLDDSSYGQANERQFYGFLDSINGGGYDALILGGDYSDGGKAKYYDIVKDAIEERTDISPVLWAIGNHEYGYAFTDDAAKTRRLFTESTGMPDYYYHTTLNGYHFIVLGTERASISDLNDGMLSEEQINWFKGELAAAAEDSHGKPIFVVSHCDIGANSMEKDFAGVMSDYENVVFLWGHEHDSALETLDENIDTASFGFTLAHMGAMNYYSPDDGIAQGLKVNVYSDRVEFTVLRTSGKALSPDKKTVYLESAPAESAFTDVEPERWSSVYINELARAGVVNGIGGGLYAPEKPLKLGESLKLIMMACGGELIEAEPGSHWASGFMAEAERRGYIAEGDDPERVITRLEMAQIAAKAAELPETEAQTPFTDADDKYVTALSEAGIINGFGDGRFGPDGSFTREQAAKVVYFLMEYVDDVK